MKQPPLELLFLSLSRFNKVHFVAFRLGLIHLAMVKVIIAYLNQPCDNHKHGYRFPKA